LKNKKKTESAETAAKKNVRRRRRRVAVGNKNFPKIFGHQRE